MVSVTIKNDSTTVSRTSSDVTNQCKHQDSLKALLEDMNSKYSFKVTVISIRLETEHLLEGSNYIRNCICQHLISVKIEKGLSSEFMIIFHLEGTKNYSNPYLSSGLSDCLMDSAKCWATLEHTRHNVIGKIL